MKVQLEVLSGPLDGHIYVFNSTSDIGREAKLRLAVDRFISRRHAILEVQATTVSVEDLNSTNGTFVDDARLQGKVELSNGKIFRIGRTWLQVRW